MIIAVFFAIFAVALLYMAVGAGQSVLEREHLQDASDSAALSGAIAHARIMNVLVLMNMVMVMLLAILVTLKLIEGVAIVGMAIAGGLAWCTAGASLAAIPPLKALQSTVSTLYEQAKEPIFDALETLHDVGNEISKRAPSVAEAMAESDIDRYREAIVDRGFAATTASELPVADDTFEGLCGRAGQLSWDTANIPLKVIPGWGVLSGAVSGPMGTLTKSLSAWFCGDGQNTVPDLGQYVDIGMPSTKQSEACAASDPEAYEDGKEQDATSSACQEANAERLAAAPDAEGNCREQCEPGGPYDRTVTSARSNCDPTLSPAARRYVYQIQEGTVEYKWDGRAWIRQQPVVQKSEMNSSPMDHLPCATDYSTDDLLERFNVDGDSCGQVTADGFFPGYNSNVHPSDDAARVLPACTNECPPLAPPDRREVEPSRTVPFRQVTHVFGCVRKQRVDVDVHLERQSPNNQAQQEGNSKSPKRVTEGLELGAEPFQIRSAVFSRTQERESSRLVRLSLWGRATPENPAERYRTLGGFAFAQAEYFYDGSEGRDAWMWNMNWRGRLRRFELPTADEAIRALREGCGRHLDSKDCSQLLGRIEEWKCFLFH
jgi:hypothetical protein